MSNVFWWDEYLADEEAALDAAWNQQAEDERREREEREIANDTLRALWDIALTQAKTNKPITMKDGSHCCPHCGKQIEVAEEWWEAQDREISDAD